MGEEVLLFIVFCKLLLKVFLLLVSMLYIYDLYVVVYIFFKIK